MNSTNMNYFFNVEYFENINLLDKEDKHAISTLNQRNEEITNYKFDKSYSMFGKINGESISLYTAYPGMLIGMGNPHSVALEGAIKCGFTFDYVTGMPYLPGSSLKGILRSYFPENEKNDENNTEKRLLIKELLEVILNTTITSQLVDALRDNIFENNDIFIGAEPVVKDKVALLAMEYITPHKRKTANPNPITLLKIRPNVKMNFYFRLNDFSASIQEGEDQTQIKVTAEQKKVLFKELLLLGGVGAKTNVGFGALVEKPCSVPIMPDNKGSVSNPKANNKNAHKDNKTPQMKASVKQTSNDISKCIKCGTTTQGGQKLCQACHSNAPVCKECNKQKCSWNVKAKKWFPICTSCNKKRDNS